MMSKAGQTNNLLGLELKLEWYQSCKQPEAVMREMIQYLTKPQAQIFGECFGCTGGAWMMLSASCRPRESQSKWNTAKVVVLTSTQHLKELGYNAQPEFLFVICIVFLRYLGARVFLLYLICSWLSHFTFSLTPFTMKKMNQLTKHCWCDAYVDFFKRLFGGKIQQCICSLRSWKFPIFQSDSLQIYHSIKQNVSYIMRI